MLAIGVGALVVAYLGMAVLGPLLLGDAVQPVVLVGGHLAALAVALGAARRVDVGDRDCVLALLHARVDAVLRRVRADGAGLSDGLSGKDRGMSDDDDWVGTPPEGRYTRDRAKPEFWQQYGWVLGCRRDPADRADRGAGRGASCKAALKGVGSAAR